MKQHNLNLFRRSYLSAYSALVAQTFFYCLSLNLMGSAECFSYPYEVEDAKTSIVFVDNINNYYDHYEISYADFAKIINIDLHKEIDDPHQILPELAEDHRHKMNIPASDVNKLDNVIVSEDNEEPFIISTQIFENKYFYIECEWSMNPEMHPYDLHIYFNNNIKDLLNTSICHVVKNISF